MHVNGLFYLQVQSFPRQNGFNPFPDDKMLPFSKLKTFADNNFNVAQTGYFFLFDKVETLLEQEELLVTQTLRIPEPRPGIKYNVWCIFVHHYIKQAIP